MSIGQDIHAIINSSLHTPHFHPLHSYYYLSSPSHHQEIQISPPLFDATGRTCIATGRSYNAARGAYGAIVGRSEEENNPKDHPSSENDKEGPPMTFQSSIHTFHQKFAQILRYVLP